MSPLMAELLIPPTQETANVLKIGEEKYFGLDLTSCFTQLLIFKLPILDQHKQIFIPSGARFYNPGMPLTFDRAASGNFGTSEGVIRHDAKSERAECTKNALD